MKKLMCYRVTVAPVPASIDAVAQLLTVTGAYPDTLEETVIAQGGTREFEAVCEVDGVVPDPPNQVSMVLRYADAGGMVSEPSTPVTFSVVDVIGPDAPLSDVLSVECYDERIEEDVVPEPPTE